VWEGGGQIKTRGRAEMAAWSGSGGPSRQGCEISISSDRIQYDDIATGKRYCVHTEGGNWAYLEILNRTEAGFRVSVIRWSGSA